MFWVRLCTNVYNLNPTENMSFDFDFRMSPGLKYLLLWFTFNKVMLLHTDLFSSLFSPMLFLGMEYKIEVHFYAEYTGFYEQLLVFKFKTGQQPSDKFEIIRLLEVIHRMSFSEELPSTATTSLCDLQVMNQTRADGYITLTSCNIHVIYLGCWLCCKSLLMKSSKKSSTFVIYYCPLTVFSWHFSFRNNIYRNGKELFSISLSIICHVVPHHTINMFFSLLQSPFT